MATAKTNLTELATAVGLVYEPARAGPLDLDGLEVPGLADDVWKPAVLPATAVGSPPRDLLLAGPRQRPRLPAARARRASARSGSSGWARLAPCGPPTSPATWRSTGCGSSRRSTTRPASSTPRRDRWSTIFWSTTASKPASRGSRRSPSARSRISTSASAPAIDEPVMCLPATCATSTRTRRPRSRRRCGQNEVHHRRGRGVRRAVPGGLARDHPALASPHRGILPGTAKPDAVSHAAHRRRSVLAAGPQGTRGGAAPASPTPARGGRPSSCAPSGCSTPTPASPRSTGGPRSPSAGPGRRHHVEGFCELRWSHGKLQGHPECKVQVTTPLADIPGYRPMADG